MTKLSWQQALALLVVSSIASFAAGALLTKAVPDIGMTSAATTPAADAEAFDVIISGNGATGAW